MNQNLNKVFEFFKLAHRELGFFSEEGIKLVIDINQDIALIDKKNMVRGGYWQPEAFCEFVAESILIAKRNKDKS